MLNLEDLLKSPAWAEIKNREKEAMVEVEEPEIPSIFPEYLRNDPQVVGYPDADFQDKIYAWVWDKIERIDHNRSLRGDDIRINIRINDFGCGRGDFMEYIGSIHCTYHGYELKNTLVRAGNERHGLSIFNGEPWEEGQTVLHNENFLTAELPECDITLVIGTLNENTGVDKWQFFASTLNAALKCTKRAVIFVLAREMEGVEGYNDFPFRGLFDLFDKYPTDIRFEIDYAEIRDIYMLTVHIGGHDM